MGEYGLKIKNIEAGSLYGYNLGVRDNYEYKNAMFTNSLFSDFIIEAGLNVWKGESTRDIICIEFNYGSRSYDEEVSHLEKQIKKTEANKPDKKTKKVFTEEEKERRLSKFKELQKEVEQNKSKYKKKSAQQIRNIFYTEGVNVEYVTRNKQGDITNTETIHYKMLYRTPGKAKKGSCMFINEKLYTDAIKFLRMGIDLPIENSPIVEMGAYSSLITSSIVGKVKINPRNILVLNDVDSFFKTKVVSVETDENRHCKAVPVDDYKLKNTLFDGQALIDRSIFPEWGDGYILLRHHLCKMAAFCSNIQLFFRDYYGDNYYTAKVKDMWGNEHYVKDIELITTDNAMKWLKFKIPYDYWCDRVYENDCMFGIVKTAHKSKLGEVQRMSYQMINSLDINIMEQVCQCSIDYIEKLKTDDDTFLDYLRDNTNFSNDYEVLVALCDQDRDFIRSEYFRERKKAIIKTYVMNFKNGKIIQNADNLVIIGSPYAMLLHSVGEDIEKDPTFKVEPGTIQCYTSRFKDGEYLAEFRSPFNSKNNMGYLHNIYHEYMTKYFNFGKQIIAVNMIGTDFQDRNNGSDQDSDSIYTTNQGDIVNYAKHCYINFPTIVNNIPMEKNSYSNELINYSNIDNNLAAAQLAIGESSNLAQLCLTYTYNFTDQKYIDYVCILSVLAQVAIDNAKRRFDIDLTEEIKKIKEDMNIKENGYPKFWMVIKRDFNKNRINPELKCPMNFIFDIEAAKFRSSSTTLPMSTFFIKYELEEHRRKSKKVEELIQKYSLELYTLYQNPQDDDFDDEDANDNYLLLRNDFDLLLDDIRMTYISKNYLGLMSWLIDRAFMITPNIQSNNEIIKSNISTNKSILIKTLYDVNHELFLRCFSGNISKKMDTEQKTTSKKAL